VHDQHYGALRQVMQAKHAIAVAQDSNSGKRFSFENIVRADALRVVRFA